MLRASADLGGEKCKKSGLQGIIYRRPRGASNGPGARWILGKYLLSRVKYYHKGYNNHKRREAR